MTSWVPLPEAVDAPPPWLVREQAGVLSLRQAAGLLSPAALRGQLTAARWQRVHRRLVVCHNGPLTAEQTWWAALLAAPPGSALGGGTALMADGMTGIVDQVPLVLIPQGSRRPRLDGARSRWSAALGPTDVHPARSPRRTLPARSLTDAAASARTPAAARVLLLQGVQQGLATPYQLGEVLRTRGQCHYLAVLREVVADMEGGVRSIPEAEFAAIVRRAGLPEPTRQGVVQHPGGRWYLDARWSRCRVAAEVEGAHHADPQRWDGDWNRHNELTARFGWRVLHFTSWTVRHEPDRIAAVLTRALTGGSARPTPAGIRWPSQA